MIVLDLGIDSLDDIQKLDAKDSKKIVKNISTLIKQKEKEMNDAVKNLDFETAALLRDEMLALTKIQQDAGNTGTGKNKNKKEKSFVLQKKTSNAFMDMEKIGDEVAEKLQPKRESKHVLNVTFGKKGAVKKVKENKRMLGKKKADEGDTERLRK
jgi:excinuclease UvrABC nuclease subunit